MKNQLPVVFRKFKNGGDIIALFPTLPCDMRYNCTSYQHIGQHGPAGYDLVIAASVPAKKEEYEPLLNELISIGYNDLRIVQKQTPTMRKILVNDVLSRLRGSMISVYAEI